MSEPTVEAGRRPGARVILWGCLFLAFIAVSYLAPLWGYDPFGDGWKQLYERYPRVVGSVVLAAVACYTWFSWKHYRATSDPVSFSWLAMVVIALLLVGAGCIAAFLLT